MAQHLALRLQKPTFKSVVKQVIRNQIVFRNGSFFRERAIIREELRRVIREEFGHVRHVLQEEIHHLLLPLRQQLQRQQPMLPTVATSEPRFRLRFIDEVSDRIYTGCAIQSKSGSPITFELVDSNNGDQRVTTGRFSCLQVEILVLRSEFAKNEWDKSEFRDNVMRRTNGKAPLLDGNVYVTLREGLGAIDNVKFTDVSSRNEGKKFRLGAGIVTGHTSHDEVNVKEARSNVFTVKCGRLKDNDKHHPPKPNSEVWRLIQIGRNGPFHKGLEKNNIYTVQDFLYLFNSNPTKLRQIINESGNMSENTWKNVISHAKECKIIVEGGGPNHYQLEPSQQVLVGQQKFEAYNNTDKFIRFDDHHISSGLSVQLSNSDELILSEDQGTSNELEIPSMRIGNDGSIYVSSSPFDEFDFPELCSPLQINIDQLL